MIVAVCWPVENEKLIDIVSEISYLYANPAWLLVPNIHASSNANHQEWF